MSRSTSRAHWPRGEPQGAPNSFNSDEPSPDLLFAALAPVELGDSLEVVDLESGRSTTAVRPADLGDDIAIDVFEWAPTSDTLAFALASERGVVPGIWVVNRDGTGLRQVSSFQIESFEGNSTIAWRPARLEGQCSGIARSPRRGCSHSRPQPGAGRSRS